MGYTYFDTARGAVEAGGASAGGHSGCEGILVRPAVDEVGMQAVTSGVTHGVDPVLVVGVGGCVIEELVEDRVNGLGVGLRADAAVVIITLREGDL
jgi:hypothetical protein